MSFAVIVLMCIDRECRITQPSSRVRNAMAGRMETHAARLKAQRTALGHLDPTQVLGRGYSIVRDADGHIRHTSEGLAPDAALDITFSKGGAGVRVVKVEKSV